MRLTDFLSDLGPLVSYYPRLNKITGSVTATIFMTNLLAWEGHQRDPEGWIYKTRDAFVEETGLTRYEQETARRHLRDAGLLEEKLRGVPATMHYRLNLDAINDAWDATYKRDTISPSSRGDSPQLNGGKPSNKKRAKQPSISEVTPEDSSECISEREGGSLAHDEDAAMTGATAPPTLSESRIRVKALSDEYRDKYGKRTKGGI